MIHAQQYIVNPIVGASTSDPRSRFTTGVSSSFPFTSNRWTSRFALTTGETATRVTNGTSRFSSITSSALLTTTRVNPIYPSQPAFPLPNSNCVCSYDSPTNMLTCSPGVSTVPANFVFSVDKSAINVTLSNCRFPNYRFNLPTTGTSRIDLLILIDINRQDYLVFDRTSFESYRITQIHIIYTVTQPVTILLISDDTFTGPFLRTSLAALRVESCYLLALPTTFRAAQALQSMILVDIEQLSWFDIQNEIRPLNQVRTILIQDETSMYRKNIANVLSCNGLSPQWRLIYRSLQTCSCDFFSFLKSTQKNGESYQCPNSSVLIEIIADRCELNGKEYRLTNNTDQFCRRCSTFLCPFNTVCIEAPGFPATCLPRSRLDYDIIRQRVPATPLTNKFLFRETQAFLNFTANQTLDSTSFSSITNILIDANRKPSPKPPSEAQLFHQTFADMLARPWANDIFATQSVVWQGLFQSLDESVKLINDSDPKFEFHSKPISTLSIRFPDNQMLQPRYGWKIDANNTIIGNISDSDSNDENVTSRVFLHFPPNRPFQSRCPPNQVGNSCSNRYSITSFKTSKLFYDTDRVPEYDVLSINAPENNQTVTFYFDQKVAWNETYDSSWQSNISSNAISNTSLADSFYDQLDSMIPQGTCMYLNTSAMVWQTDGCYTDREKSTSTSVTCTCEHLTMFTVFFSLTCATPSKTLYILSWIGCALSLIGLVCALILLMILSRCRQKKADEPTSSSSSAGWQHSMTNVSSRLSTVKLMLLVLCSLLIIMNVLIFILTFIKSGRNLACTIFAAALYYFTLAAFLWKFCFALQQSFFITNLLRPHWSNRKVLIVYFLVTFVLPLCPLLVMFIKYPNSTFISSNCNFCWLTREFLLYGLIIPILVIVALNFVLYIYTMIYLCRRNRQQNGLRSTKSEHSRQMQNLKIALFFGITMGLSWILGFFLLIPNSSIQWIGNIFFCVINSLQGFLFALMVIVMIERSFLRRLCVCCFTRQRDSTKSSVHTTITPLTTNASTDSSGLNHRRTKKDNDDEHIYSSPVF